MKGVGIAGVLALSLFSATAFAGRGKPCDSCESCTEMLSRPGVEVAVSGPLQGAAAGSGACITIRGAGATFDGSRHRIEAATAVSIEADDVVVRHLRAAGGERVMHVTGDRATVIDAQIAEGKVGIHVDGAADFRLVRSRVERVGIGVVFAGVPSDSCRDGAPLRSPGAVLQRVELRGTGGALVACEALPVVMDSTISGNAVGWVQGAPKATGDTPAHPHDPCICSPSLDGVQPGTTLLYSSGCSGSQYHEGLLPDVLAQGHDVNLRRYGRENRDAMQTYDAYVRRCAPEITDAIGIPGCMPNYACIANGSVAKRRGDDDRLVVDERLSTADDVAQFAARCVSAAAAHFGDDVCQTHAMRGTTLCGNETDLKSTRALTGVDNRCAGPKGLDCSPCGEQPAAAPTPTAAPTPAPPSRPATPTPAAAPTPRAAEPTPAPPPAEPSKAEPPAAASPVMAAAGADSGEASTPGEDSEGGEAWWLPLVVLPLGAGLGVAFARRG